MNFPKVSTVLIASSLLLAGFNPATSAQTPEPIKSYVLPGDAVFPEGIAFRPSTKTFYVSGSTDGRILEGNLGTPTAEEFLPAGAGRRNKALGLKIDEAGQLFVTGGETGKIFVYNLDSKALVKVYSTPAAAATLINDVTLTTDSAYFTDSSRPVIFRVPKTAGAGSQAEAWRDLTNDPVLKYQAGFNLNGIATTLDGKYLIVGQTNTGLLFRIGLADKSVTQVQLDGQLSNSDGLLFNAQTLYVVRPYDKIIVPVTLVADFASGTLGTSFSDASLNLPTTIARVGGRLLVVNSQLDKVGPPATAVTPFTVSNIAIPKP